MPTSHERKLSHTSFYGVFLVFKILAIKHHYKEILNMYKATVSWHSAVKYRCHQIYCTVRNVTYKVLYSCKLALNVVYSIDLLKETWLSYCFLAWSVFVWYAIKIDIRPRPVSLFSDPVLSGQFLKSRGWPLFRFDCIYIIFIYLFYIQQIR